MTGKIAYLASVFALVLLWGFLGLGIPKEQSCANSVSCIKDLSGMYELNQESVFLGRKISSPLYLADNLFQKKVLGESSEQKRIFVDLATQKLSAYEGGKLVLSFPVSTGKWGRTPTGDFRIWVKLRYVHMEGGSGADYYNLHNVPYTMFFSNKEIGRERGYSLHGAYWHNNFGYPMSHGCVNIRPEDAAKLYDFADPVTQGPSTHASVDNPGTLVTIYGEPPTTN